MSQQEGQSRAELGYPTYSRWRKLLEWTCRFALAEGPRPLQFREKGSERGRFPTICSDSFPEWASICSSHLRAYPAQGRSLISRPLSGTHKHHTLSIDKPTHYAPTHSPGPTQPSEPVLDTEDHEDRDAHGDGQALHTERARQWSIRPFPGAVDDHAKPTMPVI